MSTLTLIIGNKNYSSWSLRPWLFLKKFDIPFTEKRIPLFTDETDQELEPYKSDYKVPVLKDGSDLIWDSLAILEYVSERYCDSRGWPSDQRARAYARSMSAEMHSSFINIRSELPMNCRKFFKGTALSDAAEREKTRILELWRECRIHHCDGGPWLFGDFTIADAMFAPVVLRFKGYDIPLDALSNDYAEHLLADKHIKDWIEAGRLEKEVIEQDEL